MRTNSWSRESRPANTSRREQFSRRWDVPGKPSSSRPPLPPAIHITPLRLSSCPRTVPGIRVHAALAPQCHPPTLPVSLSRLRQRLRTGLHAVNDTGPTPLARPLRTTARGPARLPTHCAQAAVARMQQVRRAQSPSCPAGARGRQSRGPELQSCGRGLPRPPWPGRPPEGPPRAAARPSAPRAAEAGSQWALRSAPFHLDFCRRGNFGFGDDLRSYWLAAGGVGGHGCSCYSAPRGAAKRLVSSQQVPSASPGSRVLWAGRGAASLCK